MKKLLLLSAIALVAIGVQAQGDKSQRPSPPAKVSETTSNGVTISIDYSQPSVKGRTIGTDIAPYGKVWRTGANEATVFEVNKDVKVEGKSLPAGKYGLYSIPGKEEWVIIFSKTWNTWGTNYKEADDALRVNVKPGKAPSATERMTFTVDKSGKVSLLWGNEEVDFKVQ
ncbi:MULTISPECIES: DUF2911 domain-containing protein [Niastella]|uniref:DUF2911 domain-containing protein n=1 Tax=Niastella soli TaxID=2821487 RepID=A0ABS3Z0D7_9BACT|nr:DUF2911 domain-containing protein [Niastella soli]MBO9203613.1 DUF2911 domain-containing protein [Niastella soli]